MPFTVKNLRNTRHDPARSQSGRAGHANARNGRVNINGRLVRPGSAVVLPDAVLLGNSRIIRDLHKQGIVSVVATRSTSTEALAAWAEVCRDGAPPAAPEPQVPVQRILEVSVDVARPTPPPAPVADLEQQMDVGSSPPQEAAVHFAPASEAPQPAEEQVAVEEGEEEPESAHADAPNQPPKFKPQSFDTSRKQQSQVVPKSFKKK